MKWIFSILVALNLIVFGSTMAQKLVLKNLSADKEAARTIVIQTPPTPPTAPPAPPEEIKKTTKTKPADKPKTQTPTQTSTQTTPSLSPAEPRRCGGASVTLKENDYHRIKGLLDQWPNAASRDVERNPNVGQSVSKASDFWVIVPAQNDSNEQMMSLMAKGFQPSRENGLVVLGKFPARSEADTLRQQVISAGFAANVMEKIREGGRQSLSMTTYNVAFLNINDDDAHRLSAILKPYAALRRYPCKK